MGLGKSQRGLGRQCAHAGRGAKQKQKPSRLQVRRRRTDTLQKLILLGPHEVERDCRRGRRQGAVSHLPSGCCKSPSPRCACCPLVRTPVPRSHVGLCCHLHPAGGGTQPCDGALPPWVNFLQMQVRRPSPLAGCLPASCTSHSRWPDEPRRWRKGARKKKYKPADMHFPSPHPL